ncbi:MAG: hypothetical protein HGA31_03280 [Candidatus Moranbacteria bacterium]|nr:hypothetical protein [Candidatus Moranbacteria bacterium]
MVKKTHFFKEIGRIRGFFLVVMCLMGTALPIWDIWQLSREWPNIVQTFDGLGSRVAGVVTSRMGYPVHRGIYATYFWVGEDANKDNKQISNSPSAWDDAWLKHFGGVDDPKRRNGYFPAGFTPKENPFYVALPYNDFTGTGNRRSKASAVVPWAKTKAWKSNESMLKNRWVKITRGNKTVYAQWEDVGPFGENDAAYVFGSAKPKSKTNKSAGIDLSPAAHDYLGLGDLDMVDWQFVDDKNVPNGPWRRIVTTSQVYWQ